MGERVFVLGAGRSGISAARLAQGSGAEVFLFDENADNLCGGDIDGLKLAGAVIVDFPRRFDFVDISSKVVTSPGVPLDNEVLKYAEKRGKKTESELEFGFSVCRAPVIALTGTNGKTTTTALTAHLLSSGGLGAEPGGNIGRPFCDFAAEIPPEKMAVLEVSSFMCEHIFSFRPRVGALLNITPDHLNRHKTMENYIAAKLRLFENQSENDFAVLNFDDAAVVENAEGLKARKYYFSLKNEVNGAYTSDGKIFFGGQYVCPVSAVKILGEHNLQNALAAVTIAKILNIENHDIENGLATFKGVSHRLELVAESGGLKFFNDSKATNIDSTLKAVSAVTGATVLLLGGSDKGYEYDALFESLPPHIEHCMFTGEVTDKLIDAAERCGYQNYTVCASFGEATARAAKMLQSVGGNVLLSPAAASFDAYKNFEHRGEAFKKIVEDYVRKTAE